jgi:hypothetical protein
MATAKSFADALLAQKWTGVTSPTSSISSMTACRWWVLSKGIPRPTAAGAWRQVGFVVKFLEKLLHQQKIPGIRLFPKGIPVVDQFDVNFTAGSAQER